MRLRLAFVWLAYMLGLGTFFPYFSLYLGTSAGLSSSRVGLVVGVMPLVGVLTLPFWGHIADRTGTRRATLAATTGGTALLSLLIGRLEGLGPLLLVAVVLAVFSTAVLPLLTAATLAAVEDAASSFGGVRMWGTVGFLLAVVGFPQLLEWLGPAGVPGYPGLGVMFPVVAVTCGTASLLALTLPPLPSLALRAEPGEARKLLGHPPVRRLLLIVFFAHAMMQGPIQLFPLFLAARGGDATTVGSMWVAMLALEIPLVAFSGRTLRGLGARGLIAGGLGTEAVRWAVSAFAPGLAWVRGAQLLHGAGVAGVFIGSPLYLEQAAPPALRSTGQTLISTAGFGAGAIFSITAAGWLMEHVSPTAPYLIASVGTAILCFVTLRILPPPTRQDASPPSARE